MQSAAPYGAADFVTARMPRRGVGTRNVACQKTPLGV